MEARDGSGNGSGDSPHDSPHDGVRTGAAGEASARRGWRAGRRLRLATAVLLAAAAGAGAVALGTAAGGPAQASGGDPPACGGHAPQLTVHGTGEASGTPNVLTLTLAVDVSAPSAQTALADDNGSTQAVVTALTGGGVARSDVQTTGLSIQPSYDKTGALTGYAVDNNVVATIHDVATAGQVVDAAAGAAGNAVRIDSLAFSIQDPRRLQDRARLDAVHQAVSHASTMALAAGERLGPVCSLTDDTSAPTGTSYGTADAGNLAQPSVPLEAGTQQASAQVTLVYALERGRGRSGDGAS